jgi:hypothetical protein
VTVLMLLVSAAMGVAGLLYWWGGRLDTEATPQGPPPFYPPPPSPPRIHVNGNGNGNGAPRRTDAPVFRPVAAERQRMNYRTTVRPRDDEHDNAETMRFVRPSDLSVQLLPGRLEVLEGATPHREIRFLRVPGEPAQVILGRQVGLTPHYVGLESPTVSRRHARFDFADNQWIVKNLSRTNPLVVNDDELSDPDVARPLVDGDRLELGDVVLRFHAH